jgi:ATP-dependent helicase HrpB
MTDLPIEPVLPDLQAALHASPSAVLQAPPGAGKTTRVPLSLLDESWLEGQKIVMLEPRRLATRAAAHRMADLLGEDVGETIGYRMRMDTRVGRTTHIEVVTEGVLTRFLQDDPTLDGIGLVIFDEFHERSLQADLGLALTLEARAAFRVDLRVLVMSATLDGEAVAALLDDAPTITSEGRTYPVETHYLERRPEGRTEDITASAIRRALPDTEGDVLVFLPGAGEIRRTEERLQDPPLPDAVDVYPLFGNLPFAEQDRAIEPSPPGRRKVVLATPIAETSLTIEGVQAVVDSGWMRVPRFDPQSGMTRLATIRVSQASAEQRRGRAGRLGPGTCYRLWTRATQQRLIDHSPPEILEADLAPMALELAAWGVQNPASLAWLDPPPEAAHAQARDLLRHLGALDADGRITDHGRRMATLGLHPRLAHMLLCALDLGHGALACDVAALLSERDVLKGVGGPPDADLRLRLEILHAVRDRTRDAVYRQGMRVDRGAVHRVLRVATYWARKLNVERRRPDLNAAGLLLAFAYPDRIAQSHPSNDTRFTLRSGRAATLTHPQLLSDAEFLVAATLDGQRRESRIFLAAPVAQDDLYAHFSDHVDLVEVITWDGDARMVRARQQEQLGALVLKDGPLPDPAPTRMAEALLDGLRAEGLRLLPWTKKTRALRQRLAFLHHHFDDWPDVSDEALLAAFEDWLLPHLYGCKRADDLQRLDLKQILLSRLDWEQRQRLDDLAPTHYQVPSGSRIRLDYSDPDAPVLAVRLQEMFGCTTTPRIAGGRVPLTLHLLSPAHRPAQITQDLESFWAHTYFDVKKDLMGRYPKHYWPDDPLRATPTNRTKPRR